MQSGSQFARFMMYICANTVHSSVAGSPGDHFIQTIAISHVHTIQHLSYHYDHPKFGLRYLVRTPSLTSTAGPLPFSLPSLLTPLALLAPSPN